MIIIPPAPGQIWIQKVKLKYPRFVDVTQIRNLGDYDKFEIEITPISDEGPHSAMVLSSDLFFQHYMFCLDMRDHIDEWMSKNTNWRPIPPDVIQVGDILRNDSDPSKYIRVMSVERERMLYLPIIRHVWGKPFISGECSSISKRYSYVVNTFDMLKSIWTQAQHYARNK